MELPAHLVHSSYNVKAFAFSSLSILYPLFSKPGQAKIG